MQHSKAEWHAALRQSGLLVVACAALLTLGLTWAGQPASAVELRIPIEALHSDAAELALLCNERDAGRLSGEFLRAHLRQLAKLQRSTYRELARLRVTPGLEPLKADAVGEGLELVRALSALRRGAAVPATELDRVRDRLAILAHGLRS